MLYVPAKLVVPEYIGVPALSKATPPGENWIAVPNIAVMKASTNDRRRARVNGPRDQRDKTRERLCSTVNVPMAGSASISSHAPMSVASTVLGFMLRYHCAKPS